jgi:hypothetical protein
MNALVYLLQVSGSTAIFYLFYYFFLRKLTFFALNRWYLLATLLASFIIPILTIPVSPEQQHIAVVQQVVYVNTLQYVPVEINHVQNAVSTIKPIDWLLVLKTFYFAVVTAITFHLVITLILFFKGIKGKQISKMGHVNILHGNHQFKNSSFFNYVFLNDQELSANEMQQIVAHEMMHVKLYHSFDRLLVKLIQIVLWFNPFIYLYAKAVEENHEFEVDREMVYATDKKKYADLLLHLSGAGQGMLHHSFSKIPLKKRITMLFSKPSSNMKKVIYLLIVPVVLVSCLKGSTQEYSVIDGVEKLGKNPLVLIDGKSFGKGILYKIGSSCIKNMGIWSPNPAIKKHGMFIKDGFVEITTKNGKVSYMTAVEVKRW